MSHYSCIVVGAGHAGCEAAMALARLGHDVLVITSNVDRIGHLSCNPAIGGLAKGHLVREIDALGGCMGKWADESGIQFRILNASKGPAVRARRAQIDRETYLAVVKRDMFAQQGLTIWQDMVTEILAENGRVVGVRTQLGKEFFSEHVLLTTGTFLRGLVHVGLVHYSAGRFGDSAAMSLSDSLRSLGLTLGRLKTGTTPRLLASTIDFDALEAQYGDEPPQGFSFSGPGPVLPQLPCYVTWTNERTHDIIRSGMDRSPLFTGVITGVGARYCPSVEDKVARFPQRERHHVFIEPEGLNREEYYANGISTSLPLDIQEKMVNSIRGLEHAKIVRPGYAIEYDYVNPVQLRPTFETRKVDGLWLAGQINGTSGYEEAAAQGMWAALNIDAKIAGKEPFLPARSEAYMAVLADELVTKGTNEPFRMFTSRAEYRLLLREDNADARLTPRGRDIGLVNDEQWRVFRDRQQTLHALMDKLKSVRLTPDAPTQAAFAALGEPCPSQAVTLADLGRRPQLSLRRLSTFLPELNDAPDDVIQETEIILRYSGYLELQDELVRRAARQESIRLPEDMDYTDIAGLSREIQEKLNAIRPLTLGQAGRISGVTPAALACLEIELKKRGLFTTAETK
ncbi:tRNA uridine-5-carboxymethylaminomethyl(34) synthesis enzyme MnmG [Mailhella sp.]|uniref:tRNA uridine-5-carboxymethylaminomethyl(34) synthesis enzyme MnmG n=1 Tax=Mailhella sp. TaxID=1981029 RepID=UPI003AB64E17